ncbi:MAG: sulfotransferase, partial [Rubrobacteraceae bacterium]
MSKSWDVARRGFERVWREASARYPRLTALRAGAARVSASGVRGVDPAKMVWIFGSGRSGSTWLRGMMGEMSGHVVWEEPMVGRLFGSFYNQAQKANLRRADFIMGDPTREGWIRSIRNFILDGAQYAHPLLGPNHHLIVKEPNGSTGAPLVMEALPESRMILLIRDPRDVAASGLDATKEGSWLHDWADKGRWKKEGLADKKPDALIKRRSNRYVAQIGASKKAYDAHKGP